MPSASAHTPDSASASGGGSDDVVADVVARLARHLERCLAEVSLTLPQMRMLLHINERNRHGDAPIASEMARQAQIRPPSLTALVDGLASRDLVERRTDPNDRRRVLLHITTAGAEALTEARQACAARLADIAAYDDQPADALAALMRWVPLLDQWRDEHRP